MLWFYVYDGVYVCCGDNGAEDVNLCKIYPKGVVICENAARLSTVAAGVGALLFYGEWLNDGNLIPQTSVGCNVPTCIVAMAFLLTFPWSYVAVQAFVLFYETEQEQLVLYSLEFFALLALEAIGMIAAVINN